jgi:phage terminase small subunit
MPPLPNPRHELFCQKIIKGKTQTEAYREAGYVDDRRNASRLVTTNDDIQKRLAELFDETIPDIIYDRKAINNIYTSLLIQAKTDKNVMVAKQIADSIAKVNGLMINRYESGSAGEFDKLSDDELIEIIATPLEDALDTGAVIRDEDDSE